MTTAAVSDQAAPAERLSVVIAPAVKAELELLARSRERSVAAEIRIAVQAHLVSEKRV